MLKLTCCSDSDIKIEIEKYLNILNIKFIFWKGCNKSELKNRNKKRAKHFMRRGIYNLS